MSDSINFSNSAVIHRDRDEFPAITLDLDSFNVGFNNSDYRRALIIGRDSL